MFILPVLAEESYADNKGKNEPAVTVVPTVTPTAAVSAGPTPTVSVKPAPTVSVAPTPTASAEQMCIRDRDFCSSIIYVKTI